MSAYTLRHYTKNMNKIYRILVVTMVVAVLSGTCYSQKNWKNLKYPIYPLSEEWIVAVNGGLTASSFMSWGIGGQITKKINPFISVRTEAYIHSIDSKNYIIGKCAFMGLGVNYSLSEYLHGYSRSNRIDFYLTACGGLAFDNQNEVVGNMGYYGNIGVGFYAHIYKNVYFNIENKVFILSNMASNMNLHNYMSAGILFRINTHTNFL